MNDRPDLAILAGAAGVHVGQGDVRPADVARLSERASAHLLVGLSTHDESQLEAALREPIDYVAIGPIQTTASKRDPDPVLGVERACGMARAARARRALPTVAIGGIDLDAASKLGQCFDMVAVIGALLPSVGGSLSEVTAKARALGAVVTRRSE
jgi:thiamine-phosphate pyrophosphorylase